MGSRKMDGYQDQLNRIERKLDAQSKTLDSHGEKLDDHCRKLDEHTRRFEANDRGNGRVEHRRPAIVELLGDFRAEVHERFDEVTASLRRLEQSHASMLTMMTRFLGDVSEARGLEKRVRRLEDSVFGRKR